MTGRVRRRIARDRRDLTFNERMRLSTGHPADAFASEAEEREAWERHRDELIARDATNRPGHRPWAFWTYDVGAMGIERDPRGHAPYEHLRYAWLAEGPEWWAAHLLAIRAQVAFLAREGALTDDEIAAIRNPSRRADGDMHAWDRAALEGLDHPDGPERLWG